jgi:hypothetical protein
LLAQEPWARQELQRHAGKMACIDAGSVALRLRVTADGYLEAAPADEAARVTIRVKLSDLPLIAQNRERAFSYVQIEGDAEFANAISSLSKSLRWEAEHDLEKVIGPVAAVRAVSGAKAASRRSKPATRSWPKTSPNSCSTKSRCWCGRRRWKPIRPTSRACATTSSALPSGWPNWNRNWDRNNAEILAPAENPAGLGALRPR